MKINLKSVARVLSKIFVLLFLLNVLSCKKFLDEKPDQKLAEPTTIEDVQAILDGYNDMNTQSPNIGALSDDDFYLTDSYYNTLELNARNAYTWQKDVNIDDGWKTMYKVILNANLSIETLNKIIPNNYNQGAYNQAYGSALFFRAFAFYQLIQVYSLPYDNNSMTMPGIPVRLGSDVNTINTRNTVAETFNQIIKDLTNSVQRLPSLNSPVTRPSKAASYGMLSNTYLAMRQYQKALVYADSALKLQQTLMDYNTINPSLTVPFTKFNAEVIFSSGLIGKASLYTRNARVDSLLYKSYVAGDLRKLLFFTETAPGQYGFKGSYQGSLFGLFFNGIAVDEMLLNRSECFARNNNVSDAMKDLNTLLLKRFKSGSFTPLSAGSATDALKIILSERRKELLGRGIRWNDLRRLNKEPGFEKILERKIGGTTIQLEPNSKRYAFYIPQMVIDMSGMAQNER